MLVPAAALILASNILDGWDGFTARRLNATSEFGLQLDSLVDMVSLGVAPSVLVFQHMYEKGVGILWIWPFSLMIAMAGAFRLARFNLLPAKESSNAESVGLTISLSGGIIALAVLSDLTYPGGFIARPFIVPLLVLLSVLMVSKISFPSYGWLVKTRWRVAILISALIFSLIVLPIFHAWFVLLMGYVFLVIIRAIYYKFKKVTQ
jgi:CDP-diacylglycerol--serine O-phosphatidyltransferase